MKTIIHDGHKIEVSGMSLTAKEEVIYDGVVVSNKRSVTGSTHIFNAKENEEDIQYEVEIGTKWHGFSAWATIRRNGKVIFSDR